MTPEEKSEIKDLSSILDSTFSNAGLIAGAVLNEPFSDEQMAAIARNNVINPMDLVNGMTRAQCEAHVHEIQNNLFIYLQLFFDLLRDQRVVDLANQKVHGLFEDAATNFEKNFKRPFQPYSQNPIQAMLLHMAVIPIARQLGAGEGFAAAKHILRQDTRAVLDKVTKKLRKKHWLTNAGYMELLLDLNPSSSRDELDKVFEKAKIGASSRRKFWATHKKQFKKIRDEWWIYQTGDGEYLYDRPDKSKDRKVIAKQIDGVEEAHRQVSLMNQQKPNVLQK